MAGPENPASTVELVLLSIPFFVVAAVLYRSRATYLTPFRKIVPKGWDVEAAERILRVTQPAIFFAIGVLLVGTAIFNAA